MSYAESGYDDRIVNFKEVELKEFIQEASQEWGAYIRAYPDRQNGEIRLYHFGSNGEDDIRTTLTGVRMRSYGVDSDPAKMHFHDSDAETLLSWLTALKWERTQTRIEFRYSAKNDSPMLEEAGVHSEMFRFTYESASGNRNTVQIDNVYQDVVGRQAEF